VKLTLLVLGALFAGEAFACSCIKPDMSRMEKSAEVVVLAQLDKNSPSLGKKKYVFAPIKTFKGAAGGRVVVLTPKFEVSCGLRARRDVPYVLFVYREEGKLMVDKCSSWPLTQEYFHFTAAFNEFYGLTGTEALEPSSNDKVGQSLRFLRARTAACAIDTGSARGARESWPFESRHGRQLIHW
jgi:hypothetical protein